MASYATGTRSSTALLIVLGCLVASPASAAGNENASWLIGAVVSSEQTAPLVPPLGSDSSPALSVLFTSYAALNALDVHSTLRATSRGARELNPMVDALTGAPLALTAAKVGVTAWAIYSARRLARTHPKAALLTMIAVNSIYATVVAHNYRVASRAGR